MSLYRQISGFLGRGLAILAMAAALSLAHPERAISGDAGPYITSRQHVTSLGVRSAMARARTGHGAAELSAGQSDSPPSTPPSIRMGRPTPAGPRYRHLGSSDGPFWPASPWLDELALASAPSLAFTSRPRAKKRNAVERGLALYAALRSFRMPSMRLCFGFPGVGPSEVSCRVRFRESSPSVLVRWKVTF